MSKPVTVCPSAAPEFEEAASLEPLIQQQRPLYPSKEAEDIARQQQQAQCYNW